MRQPGHQLPCGALQAQGKRVSTSEKGSKKPILSLIPRVSMSVPSCPGRPPSSVRKTSLTPLSASSKPGELQHSSQFESNLSFPSSQHTRMKNCAVDIKDQEAKLLRVRFCPKSQKNPKDCKILLRFQMVGGPEKNLVFFHIVITSLAPTPVSPLVALYQN